MGQIEQTLSAIMVWIGCHEMAMGGPRFQGIMGNRAILSVAQTTLFPDPNSG